MSQVSDNTNRSEDKVLSSPKDIADIAQLHAVIEREMQKPLEEQDEELIDECIQTIAEIKGVRSTFTPEEIDAQIAVVQARAEAERSAAVHRPKSVKTVLLAVCLVVIMLAGAVTVYAVSPAVREWIGQVLKLDVGSSVMSQGVTYTYDGKTKQFKNIDELLTLQNVDIYYPVGLPDGVYINSVVCFDLNGAKLYDVQFNTPNITMRIQLGKANTISPSDKREVYTNSIGTFFISQEKNIINITGIINQDIYNITMKNTFKVKDILDSLKESIT